MSFCSSSTRLRSRASDESLSVAAATRWAFGSASRRPRSRALGRSPRSELPDALFALGLEVGPLLAPQLGGGLAAEPPLAADPPPVARRPQLAEHRQHAGLHAPAHHLVGGQVLPAHHVEELGA